MNDYPGVIIGEWRPDEKLTTHFSNRLKGIATVKNTDYNISIYVKTENNPDEYDYNIRVYVKPNVKPIHAVWTLVAEGKLDAENNIKLYSQQPLINSIIKNL